MLIILRIVFGLLAVYFVRDAMRVNHSILIAGDTTPAYYLGVFVIVGILNAFVWAPALGKKLSDPVTSMLTESTFVEHENLLMKLVRWVAGLGWNDLTARVAFLECVHNPDQPAGFVIGLAHARKGSWLEKVYARELFRFDNVQHVLWAFQVLKRHGIDPRPHRRPELNLALMAVDREEKPAPTPLALPAQRSPVVVKRNDRIQLFKGPTQLNPEPSDADR